MSSSVNMACSVLHVLRDGHHGVGLRLEDVGDERHELLLVLLLGLHLDEGLLVGRAASMSFCWSGVILPRLLRFTLLMVCLLWWFQHCAAAGPELSPRN